MLAAEMTLELERQRKAAAEAAESEARVKTVIDAVVALPNPLRYLAAKLREARPDRAAVLDEIDALIARPDREEARRLARSLGEMDNHLWAVALTASVAGGCTDEPKAVLRRAVYRLYLHYAAELRRQAAPAGSSHAPVTPEIEAAALAKVAPTR